MAHEETALRTAIEIGATSVALAGAAVLLLALAAELARRRCRASHVVALADRLLPTASRRAAVALLTIASSCGSLALPAAARADEHTRTWLESGRRAPAATSTTTRPEVTTASAPSTSTTSTSSTTVPPAGSPAPHAAPGASMPVAPERPISSPQPAPVLHTVAPATTPPARPTASAPSPGPTIPTISNPNVAPDTAVAIHAVVPGECLWSIAAHRLGGGATARAIDRGWRAIYAANRDAIGGDPDLIHPGLVLTLPPLDPTP